MQTWMELWTYLTVVYRDGVKIEANEPGTDHGGNIMGGETGKVTYGTGIGNGEWPDDWKYESSWSYVEYDMIIIYNV